MTVQKSGGHWSANATVKAHRNTEPSDEEKLQRAQARAEEWVGDVPDLRDQVREIMAMLAQPPKECVVSPSGKRLA